MYLAHDAHLATALGLVLLIDAHCIHPEQSACCISLPEVSESFAEIGDDAQIVRR